MSDNAVLLSLVNRNKLQIVLISVGVFQAYVLDNIQQLLELEDFNIHVITDKAFFSNCAKYDKLITLIDADELDIAYFNTNSKLDKGFRQGFWNNTSKRLFLLYEYIKKYDIKNVLHLENDVLLYSKMNYVFDNKVYLTMDSDNRCIPGIVYIPDYRLLSNLVTRYDFKSNDMANMARFYHNNRDIVKTFPLIDKSIGKCIYNENFSEFNSIFDAAAIGQYLGGIDPRNEPGDTTGFVNETCVIKYNRYNFEWVKEGDYSLPYIRINGTLVPINNLHIHCKDLKKFMM